MRRSAERGPGTRCPSLGKSVQKVGARPDLDADEHPAPAARRALAPRELAAGFVGNSPRERELTGMPESAIRSLSDICDVAIHRGQCAPQDALPDLLIETPHGATRERDFDALAERLGGTYPDGLKDFFFVNTDVGSAELGERVAERAIAEDPTRTVMTLRSLVPRTFVDCNRVLDACAVPTEGLTPGLPPYVRHPGDVQMLVGLHATYTRMVEAALRRICGAGGMALILHTYAPRTVGVQVDDDIVRSLHWAYSPKMLPTWPLRHEVDLITTDGDGRVLSDPALLEHVHSCFERMGITPAENAAYHLHPATSAAAHSARYPGQTLCMEVRRDLVVSEFTPFAEMSADPARIDRFAGALASALVARWSGATRAA
jgi:hypothetical protein